MSSVPAARTAAPFRSKFHPDPERSSTLPSTYYYDPAIYEREKEAIFYRTWQLAGYLADLEEVGNYVTASIFDQLVFVVRGKDRRLRAFYNVCMHRGHTLVEGKGSVRMLTCPFHAWTYDLEGTLKAAGNAENVAGFDLADYGLAEVRCEEFLNMVFVNLDPDATSLKEQAGDLEAMIRSVVPSIDQLKRFRRDTYEINANWKLLGDQLECYHCPVIHPQVMGSADSYLELSFESEEHPYWSVHINRGAPDVLERMRKVLPADVGSVTAVKDVYIWFLWPNYIFLTHQGPPNFKVGHAIPTSPESVLRHMDHFVTNDPPTAFEVAQADNHVNVAAPQDREAMEKQQVGIKARGYSQGRLMVDQERSWRSEHGVHYFDNLVWHALNGDRYEV